MKKGKQKIIEAAFALITEKGIKETSIRDISKAAGISTGTFTYYYPSREDLLFEIFEITMEKQDQLLKQALASPIVEEKKASFKSFLEDINSNEYFMKLNYYLIGEAFAKNTAMHEKMKEKYKGWQIQFKEYIYGKQSEWSQEEYMNAILLVALIDGLAIQIILDPLNIPIAEIATKIIDMMYD